MRDTGPKSTASQPSHLEQLGFLAVLVAAFLALTGGSAQAAYIHPEPGYEFGPDGQSTSTFPGSGSVAEMDFDQSSKRIFMLDKSDGKVYAIHFSGPASYSAAGSPYPLTVASAGCCTDVAIDNTPGATAENLYYSPDGPPIYGFTPTGTALPSFSPESGEKCGVAVDNEGHLWSGNFEKNQMEEFEPTGGPPIKTVDVSGTGRPCRLRFDLSNNDMYVSQYSGQGAVRYTAASGYSAGSAQVFDSTTNSTIAINATRHVVYVAGNSNVTAYDTATGSPLETFGEEAGCPINGIAVDDATDTVFLSRGCTNRIQEWKGAVVPDAITGDPTSNSTVSGSVGLAGGGEVTSCKFEFGESTSYGQSEPCSPSAPYSADQPLVTADLKEDLEGETTYHYRLVASNANGTARGVDKTITPHNVKGLKTEDPDAVTRTTADLKASFEGNGEATKYYFEWGTSTAYGSESAPPPGESAGSPTYPPITPLSHPISGLQPDTVYHYQVVGENGLGKSPGGDKTFRTLPAVQSLTASDAASIGPHGATLDGSYVGDGDHTTYYFEYGKTTAYGQQSDVLDAGSPGPGVVPLTFEATGLDLDTTYHYRIVATNSLGTTESIDRSFTTLPAVGGLTINPATDISQEGVTLNAEFTGNGDETSYYFEYGTTTEYGHSTASPPGVSAGSPTGVTPISSVITDFEDYSTYHYRVVATNSQGTTRSSDMTFETLPASLPAISGTTATNVTPTSADVEATINPNRWATVYSVEYGPSSSYGESTRIGGLISGDNNDEHSITAAITGLSRGVEYHFRVVAINFVGTSYGEDRAFVTPDAPRIDKSSATAVGPTSVHIDALVAGNGKSTTVRFEYGEGGAYGAASAPLDGGSDLISRSIETEIGGLKPGATYHFRAVATNSVGTQYGPDLSVTTPAASAAPPGPVAARCRKLKEAADRALRSARQMRKQAKHSTSAARARQLRRRAGKAARKASKLQRSAAACVAGEGGGA